MLPRMARLTEEKPSRSHNSLTLKGMAPKRHVHSMGLKASRKCQTTGNLVASELFAFFSLQNLLPPYSSRMSYIEKQLTATELFEIRQKLGQTPQSMAALLDCNINTYYHYERGGRIKASVAMAIRYLATQDIPPVTQPKVRTIKTFLTQFAPGARFGHLAVEGEAPRICGKRRFKVVCDCGVEKILSAPALVQSIRCGSRCTAGGSLPSPALPSSSRPPTPTTPTTPPDIGTPEDLDPDMPDLDDDDITWRKYNHRKAEAEEAIAAGAATATSIDADNDELEAGL